MLKKFFNKEKKNNLIDKNILIISLLIHAAKIDENYSEPEKKIIIKAIMELNKVGLDEAEKLLKVAEKKEEESNQIVEFTKEIRLKVIEIIWKIVYSDGTSDNYETNLVRRICGLLYISDKDSGIIKTRIHGLSK